MPSSPTTDPTTEPKTQQQVQARNSAPSATPSSDILPSVMNTAPPKTSDTSSKKDVSPSKKDPTTTTSKAPMTSSATATSAGTTAPQPNSEDDASKQAKKKREEVTSTMGSSVPVPITNSSVQSTVTAAPGSTQDPQLGRVAGHPWNPPWFNASVNIIYQCDNCFMNPLVGVRYRCDQCIEYDLCQACMDLKPHESSHTFQKHEIDQVKVPPGWPGAAGLPLTGASAPHIGTVAPGGPGVLSIPGAPSMPPASSPVSSASATVAVGDAPARPPRRSAAVGKSAMNNFENAIERMDEILVRCNIGTLPASNTSSVIASQFLELNQMGLKAMEPFKKGKPFDQLNARVALALIGVPIRARRGPGFTARNVPHPVDEDAVKGVLSSLMAQLLALDVDRVFFTVKKEIKSPEKPQNEAIDFDRMSDLLRRGIYFRKIDTPVQAIPAFHKHLMRVLGHPERFDAPADLANKFDQVSRQAFEEIRDAMGMPTAESALGTNADVTTEAKGKTTGDKATIGSGANNTVSTSTSAGGASLTSRFSLSGANAGDAVVGEKKKKKRERESESETNKHMKSADSTAVPPAPQTEAGLVSNALAPLVSASTQVPGASVSGKLTSGANLGTSSTTSKINGTMDSETDLRAQIKRLREDLDDAHSRIDVLVHLLREKVANPLVRGLDRAGR